MDKIKILFKKYSPKKKKDIISLELTFYRIMSLILDCVYLVITGGNKKATFKFHKRKNVIHKLFLKRKRKMSYPTYIKRKFLIPSINCDVFDFGGVYLPLRISKNSSHFETLARVYEDTLLIHHKFNSNYSNEIVDEVDKYIPEGSYLYKNDSLGINMLIKKGDIVIDAGAWIGDFSALASHYGASVYAFEPSASVYNYLVETAQLNTNIYPQKLALGSKNQTLFMEEHPANTGANVISKNGGLKVKVVTLDDFVLKNKIQKVDFIKSDIEGFERQLISGALNVLKVHQPKISICTYHLDDDPYVLKALISSANPNYKFMQRKKKLFAWV